MSLIDQVVLFTVSSAVVVLVMLSIIEVSGVQRATVQGEYLFKYA